MNRILHVDSRQKIYHKEFGDISTAVPSERHFTVQNIVEAFGAVTCVAISGCKACSSQTGQVYDYQDSFDNAPHGSTGMYPNDWFGSIIKRGLKRLNSVIFDTLWPSYWRADTNGPGDRFDNTISAMNHANSATTAWSNFYGNWVNLSPLEVMPEGTGAYSDHDWVVTGWQMVNGVTVMVIDAHLGKPYFMPREIFNKEISRLGCGTGIPTTATIQAIESRDFMTWLSDVIKNLWLKVSIIQQEINTMQTTTPNPQPAPNTSTANPIVNQSIINCKPIVNKIELWAKAVQQAEGWSPTSVSFQHNNPGNLGYSTLTASWGALKGNPKPDGGWFGKFPDFVTGFKALCNFLTLGAEDELLQFHQSRTLELFSEKYGNTGIGYAQDIAKILNVPLSTDVSTFLT